MKLETNLTKVPTFARKFQPRGAFLHFTIYHVQAQLTALGRRSAGPNLNRPIKIIGNEKRLGVKDPFVENPGPKSFFWYIDGHFRERNPRLLFRGG